MPSPTSPLHHARVVAVLFAMVACSAVTVAANPSAAAVTPQGVTSAARDNGRIDVVERTTGGTVRLRSLQGGTWTAWTYLDGQTQYDPEVASWGNDRADVFVVGGDGALWHRAQTGTTWSGWQSLGGYATSSPAAVYSAGDRLDVVVRGGHGDLWGKTFNGTTWSGWYGLGGYVSSAPTIASWGPNRLDVFAAGGDSQLWHRPFSGAWGNWTPLGGVLTAAPGATSWGAGRLDVVGRGGDGAVWLRSWLGTRWSQWGSLGGSTIGAPDLATRSAGTLDLVTRGVDGSLYTRAFNGAWSGWAAVPNAHQGLEVDDTRIPAPVPGVSSFRIGPANYRPDYSDGVGAFRVNCSLSHMNYDDPIVFPGQPDATHLHAFFGNTSVDAFSTSASIANSGNSTCTGGTANRSAYWAPAMVDTSTGAPVHPWGVHGLQVYYKAGYRGVASNTVRNFPAGLRIIAGDSRRSTPFPGTVTNSPVTYHCINGMVHLTKQLAMPSCPVGQQLAMSVKFPQCWDGVNLDSPNHQSHMAYGTWGPVAGQNGAGCPASHPVPLPEITMNMRYVVPPGGMAAWRLSSDTYSGPAGYSGHADWWNGWHAPTFQRMLDNCYTTGLDCQMNLLGDGWALN